MIKCYNIRVVKNKGELKNGTSTSGVKGLNINRD